MSLTLIDFDNAIKKLELSFGTLDEDQREIYFEHIKKYHPGLFEDAISILIDVHPFKRFPLLAEIHKAVELAKARLPKDEERGITFCERCLNVGMYIVEDGRAGKARYCNCIFGRRQWAAHKTQPAHGPLITDRGPRRKEMNYPGDSY